MQSSKLSLDENRIAQAVVDAIIPVIEDKMDTQFAAFEQRMDTRFTDHMTEL